MIKSFVEKSFENLKLNDDATTDEITLKWETYWVKELDNPKYNLNDKLKYRKYYENCLKSAADKA